MRRRLTLVGACGHCGSTRLKKDAVAIECARCGAIRPRRESDEPLVAAIAGWQECPLSGRELQALRGKFDGRDYKQIALDLHLSTSTVRTHLHNTYKKLGVAGAVQACLVAHERGWLRQHDGEAR